MEQVAHLISALMGVTWRVSLLIALLWALRPFLLRWLPPRIMPWLWLVVAAKLLFVSTPGGWWSLYNIVNLDSWLHPAPAVMNLAPLNVANAGTFQVPIQPTAVAVSRPIHWEAVFGLIWLAGAALLGAAQIGTHFFFHRRLTGEGQTPDARWQHLLSQSTEEAGVRSAPLLLETNLVASPAVTGLFRPRLLVPCGLLDSLKPEDVRLLFMHELCHLRRRDLWLLTLFAALRTLHWFNPLVWLAERTLRADCETACDAEVLRRISDVPERYGETLLQLTRLTSANRSTAIAAAAISTNSNQTERRLQMIMKYRRSCRGMGIATWATVAVISALTLSNEATAQQQPPDQSPAKPTVLQSAPTPTDDPFIIRPDDEAGRAMITKLKAISINVNFDKMDVADVLQVFAKKSKELDPDKKGINFVLGDIASEDHVHRIVTILLDNCPLDDLLGYVVQQTNLKCSIEGNSVYLRAPSAVSKPTTDSIPIPIKPGVAALQHKLESIIIDKISFDKADLYTVIQTLTVKSKEFDPDKVGLNFVVNKVDFAPVVSLNMENVPLLKVLKSVVSQAKIQYSVDAYAVYLRPAVESEMLTVRTFLAPSNFIKTPAMSDAAWLKDSSSKRVFDVHQQLADRGIQFPVGATAMMISGQGKLVVRDTPEQLDLLANLIAQAGSPHPALYHP